MSVPKSRRGESPAEYINLAREIYVFTYNRVRILPKSYTFYFSLPLYNAAREAYRLIKTRTAPYKYPRIVEFREALPKTTSGKIIRSKL